MVWCMYIYIYIYTCVCVFILRPLLFPSRKSALIQKPSQRKISIFHQHGITGITKKYVCVCICVGLLRIFIYFYFLLLFFEKKKKNSFL